jgi:O-antigen ligase
MIRRVESAIATTFYLLFFSIPLVLYPYTSELFEFNKMVLTYIFTVIIVTLWLTRSILVRKFEFKRTALDIPLAIFLVTQLLSTLVTFDFRTSLLGYYSRYHGGLMSSISYSLLYWAFVSNMDREKTTKTIIIVMVSASLVSIYAVLEHFGIDKDIWVQDVQNRVFSTLGQPNWLATYIIALIPITWTFSVFGFQYSVFGLQIKKNWIWVLLSGLFYLVLIYTRSRSGFVGFATASIIFWPTIFWLNKKNILKILIPSVIVISLIVTLTIIWGTPWTETKNVSYYLSRPSKTNTEIANIQDIPKLKPRELDVKISPSSDIRKIVWQGAVDVWKNYPILGTGVETFAYSYYNFRPVEHNLLSEWDFLYNKAHNEYLNILSNTGSVGFIAYSTLLAAITILFTKNIHIFKKSSQTGKTHKRDHKDLRENRDVSNISIALLAGFASILVTNFFGFSVVPVGILFFMFPAIAISLERESIRAGEHELNKFDSLQKFLIVLLSSFTLILFYSISRYWYADLQFSKGVAHNDAGNYIEARKHLLKSTKYSPNEAVFWSELSESSAALGLGLHKEGKKELSNNFITSSINESQKAESLSPKNVNIRRKSASNLIKLSVVNPKLLINAIKTLEEAVKLAPTEAKLYYNYGLAFARAGDNDTALDIFEKTIEMKPNYRHARFARALILADKGNKEEAIMELEYILERINPDDKAVKDQLDELTN